MIANNGAPNEFDVARLTIDANSTMTINGETTLGTGIDNAGTINWVSADILIVRVPQPRLRLHPARSTGSPPIS